MDSSVGLGRDMIGFSRSNGATRTWAFLPLFLNGDDSVSVLKHFDWVIPDSITSKSNNGRWINMTNANSAGKHVFAGIGAGEDLFSLDGRFHGYLNVKIGGFAPDYSVGMLLQKTTSRKNLNR